MRFIVTESATGSEGFSKVANLTQVADTLGPVPLFLFDGAAAADEKPELVEAEVRRIRGQQKKQCASSGGEGSASSVEQPLVCEWPEQVLPYSAAMRVAMSAALFLASSMRTCDSATVARWASTSPAMT